MYKYGLFTKSEFMKKERCQYPAILTEQASVVNKAFILSLSLKFYCGTRRVVPPRQDSFFLPARVANHGTGFASSCPLTELAI